MITRIEFIGFQLSGPRGAMRSSYRAPDWQGWEVEVEGAFIILRGEGRQLELPRARCVIDRKVAVQPAASVGTSATGANAAAPGERGHRGGPINAERGAPRDIELPAPKKGRPPKVKAEDLMGPKAP